jgi:hypothetical protein
VFLINYCMGVSGYYPVIIRYPVIIFSWLVSGRLLSGTIRYPAKQYPAHPYLSRLSRKWLESGVQNDLITRYACCICSATDPTRLESLQNWTQKRILELQDMHLEILKLLSLKSVQRKTFLSRDQYTISAQLIETTLVSQISGSA